LLHDQFQSSARLPLGGEMRQSDANVVCSGKAAWDTLPPEANVASKANRTHYNNWRYLHWIQYTDASLLYSTLLHVLESADKWTKGRVNRSVKESSLWRVLFKQLVCDSTDFRRISASGTSGWLNFNGVLDRAGGLYVCSENLPADCFVNEAVQWRVFKETFVDRWSSQRYWIQQQLHRKS